MKPKNMKGKIIGQITHSFKGDGGNFITFVQKLRSVDRAQKRLDDF